MRIIRVYPVVCTSAYCGRSECAGCRNKPGLDEFKAWVARTSAEVTDPIWCPTVYEAIVSDDCVIVPPPR